MNFKFKKKKIVAVSGYFNPVHAGHLKMFEEAKKLGDFLVVIVNNDYQVGIKGSVPFMGEKERMKIVESIKPVDKVVLSIDKDKTVCKTLVKLKPDIFANGGDRKNVADIPEAEVCRRLDIKMVFNVGGGKINSSSVLIANSARNHAKELRPWGFWSVLLENQGYKIKKISVNPGHSISLQSHQKRSEHWVVVNGRAEIQKGDEIFLLDKCQSAFIPAGFRHRLSNPGKKILEIIEVQNGDYLGENDIVRFEDKYGRA